MNIELLPVAQSLSRPLTIVCCSLFTSSYVGSLYIFRATRVGRNKTDEHGQLLTRDHPKVIKARISSVLASSLVSVIGVWLLVRKTSTLSEVEISPEAELRFTAQALGFVLPNNVIKGLLYPLALTATLFAGPIYTLLLDGALPFQSDFSFKRDIVEKHTSWPGIRNYIVGPLSEEVVFRSAVIATSALSGKETLKQLTFLSPLYFGIAHVHHAWEVYHNQGGGRNALVTGALSSSFQFIYTTVFGWYASFLFLRSGSILSPLVAHVFCNIMGFPQLPQALHNHPTKRYSIYAAYASGIAGFAYAFSSLTAVKEVFGGSLYWS